MSSNDSTATVAPWSDSPPRDAPDGLQPGAVIAGRYEVRSELGRGGYGIVYEVFDRELGIAVALKVLRAGRSRDDAIRRFRREVICAREAVHPNLQRVHDIGVDGDLLYLTSELSRGGSLRDLLRARGSLPIAEAIDLGCQILEGLAALHAAGVVHRDVKPSNVLLDGCVAKLADFGLARVATAADSSSIDGRPVGTFEYLAPEQALGTATLQSDLYSFGVVLFEMLTGRHPFERSSALGTVMAHIQDAAPDIRAIRPDLPRWLAAVVARLLGKRPEERFVSAGATIDAIAARRSPFPRPRRWRALLAAAVAAVIVAGGTLTLRGHAPRRFARLVTASDQRQSTAYDAAGGILWSRAGLVADHRAAMVRLREGTRIAAVLARYGDDDPVRNHTLTFLDPDDGHVVYETRLPSAASVFPKFSPIFAPSRVTAVDLDGDGFHEIVVTYVHKYWPSYTVVYEPATGVSRIAFVASGHHHMAGAVDIDGDGRKELILVGISNRMGWYDGVAAVPVPPLPSMRGIVTSPGSSAWTPDEDEARNGRGGWYQLIPPGPVRDDAAGGPLNIGRSQIEVAYADGRRFPISFAGFWSAGRSPLSSAERARKREGAYSMLRQAKRLATAHRYALAIMDTQSAEALAGAAGDPFLVEWAQRSRASLLVFDGRVNEAQRLFRALAARSLTPSNISYDAALALHASGRLDDALAWYRAGLADGSDPHYGRSRNEFLDGAFVILLEQKRWDEAAALISEFEKAFPTQSQIIRAFRDELLVRAGRPVTPAPFDPTLPDLQRAWSLEAQLAGGAAPAALLPLVDRSVREISGSPILLLSLKAAILDRLRRHGEAMALADASVEQLRALGTDEPLVRSHAAWIAERRDRIARE
jgi:hypothetical protein